MQSIADSKERELSKPSADCPCGSKTQRQNNLHCSWFPASSRFTWHHNQEGAACLLAQTSPRWLVSADLHPGLLRVRKMLRCERVLWKLHFSSHPHRRNKNVYRRRTALSNHSKIFKCKVKFSAACFPLCCCLTLCQPFSRLPGLEAGWAFSRAVQCTFVFAFSRIF